MEGWSRRGRLLGLKPALGPSETDAPGSQSGRALMGPTGKVSSSVYRVRVDWEVLGQQGS